MAIAPTSDLILDVARAADPRLAMARTRALTDAAGASGGFASTLAGFSPSLTPYGYHNPSSTPVAAETPAHKAAVGLESVLLKTFVDQMLPKDAAGVFGAGVAGDVWKSMLSEKIANEVAKSGALKLAERLFETHPEMLQSGRATGGGAKAGSK
jgi:hypothetical protein